MIWLTVITCLGFGAVATYVVTRRDNERKPLHVTGNFIIFTAAAVLCWLGISSSVPL